MTTQRPPFSDAATLRSRQLHLLRTYLERVVIPFSPYYREKLRPLGFQAAQLRTLDDLRRIPFSSKADLTASPDAVQRFILRPDRDVISRRPGTILKAMLRGRAAVTSALEREFRPILMTSTTGRSADPVPFLYTAHDIARLETAGAWVMEVCAATREERMLNLFPFAPHLAFWIAHYAGTRFGVFMVGSGGGKTMGTEGNLRLIRKLKPDVLIGMPTFLYHVLTQAVSEGVELPNLNKIVLGGEKVPTGMRRRLRALAQELGAPSINIHATYGFTEAKMAWAECAHPGEATSGGYHLLPEQGIVEVIDPETGDPRGEGEPGEIVFTPIDARGSVVLRYRTGDVTDGGLVHAPCPHCGRVVPRITGRISRRSEVREMRLEKLKGTLVDFNALEHILDDCPGVGSWQLELRKRNDDPLEVDELILHVEQQPGHHDEETRKQLDTLFASRTEIHPNAIRFHTSEAIRELQGLGRELKESRIVDRRPSTTTSEPAKAPDPGVPVNRE